MRPFAFTLLEALIALLIFSILSALAIPPWLAFQKNQAANLSIQALEAAILTTQTLALTSHQSLSLCPSFDQLHCQPAWRDTLLIFIAHAGREQPLAASDIRARLPLPLKNNTLTWRHFQHGHVLSFDANGQLAHDNGTFRYCPADRDLRFSRALAINAVGRTRLIEQRNSQGQLIDGEGLPILCP